MNATPVNTCFGHNETNGCLYDIEKYLDELNCTSKQKYGFSSGQPCVLVKLNNVS